MVRKKVLIMFLIAMIVINIPIIIYLNSLYSLLFNKDFYSWGFERNNVYDKYADKAIPDVTAKKLIEYFRRDSEDLPDIDLFNQKEKEHLLDVKLLIDWSLDNYFSLVLVCLFCVLLLYFLDTKGFVKRLSYSLLFGGLLTILVTIVLVVSSVKFDCMFTSFHLVFFPEGNWMFPYDYNLIRLFPKPFFFEGFVVVLLLSLTQSFVLLLISSLFFIKNRQKNYKFLSKKQKIFK